MAGNGEVQRIGKMTKDVGMDESSWDYYFGSRMYCNLPNVYLNYIYMNMVTIIAWHIIFWRINIHLHHSLAMLPCVHQGSGVLIHLMLHIICILWRVVVVHVVRSVWKIWKWGYKTKHFPWKCLRTYPWFWHGTAHPKPRDLQLQWGSARILVYLPGRNIKPGRCSNTTSLSQMESNFHASISLTHSQTHVDG